MVADVTGSRSTDKPGWCGYARDVLAVLPLLVLASPAELPWQEVARSAAVTVYRRPRGGTAVTETLAVGELDAPPWVVMNALADYEPEEGQMPYVAEVKVLKRDARGTVIYNRTSPPVVDDRDYTIRMFDDSFVRADGAVVYVARWVTANQEGPPPKPGVVRVNLTEGYWRLDPIGDGKKTRASYFVFAEPGGSLPQSVADFGTNTAMADVFNALRARVKASKYRARAPARPTKRGE